MEKADIQHLAALSRIKLTDAEEVTLAEELPKIFDYVSVVSDIAADTADTEPQVGARYNVLRPDEVTNQPDDYTEAILAEMPATEGRFMKVKKILNQDS